MLLCLENYKIQKIQYFIKNNSIVKLLFFDILYLIIF